MGEAIILAIFGVLVISALTFAGYVISTQKGEGCLVGSIAAVLGFVGASIACIVADEYDLLTHDYAGIVCFIGIFAVLFVGFYFLTKYAVRREHARREAIEKFDR